MLEYNWHSCRYGCRFLQSCDTNLTNPKVYKCIFRGWNYLNMAIIRHIPQLSYLISLNIAAFLTLNKTDFKVNLWLNKKSLKTQMILKYTYMHPYIHPSIHTYLHTCMHAYINPYIHTHIYIHNHTHIYIYIYRGISQYFACHGGENQRETINFAL